MVVSNACMITESTTQNVSKPRFGTTVRLFIRAVTMGKKPARPSTRLPYIDVSLNAHAMAQLGFPGLIVNADTHRDALDHLDPIAGRILGRKQGETGARGRADTFHRTSPDNARVSVDMDHHRLPWTEIGKLSLLGLGSNPKRVAGDKTYS